MARRRRPGRAHPDRRRPPSRSTDKVAHLAANPWMEACWYFREARAQFRLSGKASIAAESAAGADSGARDAAWAHLSPASREWNAGPPPGAPLEQGARSKAPSAPAADARGVGDRATTPPPPPHPHFCLVLLDVDAVDHVDLETDRRWLHSRGEGGAAWATVEVNP